MLLNLHITPLAHEWRKESGYGFRLRVLFKLHYPMGLLLLYWKMAHWCYLHRFLLVWPCNLLGRAWNCYTDSRRFSRILPWSWYCCSAWNRLRSWRIGSNEQWLNQFFCMHCERHLTLHYPLLAGWLETDDSGGHKSGSSDFSIRLHLLLYHVKTKKMSFLRLNYHII